MTLTEFLLARIADTTATAREVQAIAVTRGIQPDDPREPGLRLAKIVLAECEAKRQLIQLHAENSTIPGRGVLECWVCAEDYPCRELRILAVPFADHPAYREGWQP